MNQIMQEYYPIFEMYLGMRTMLMDLLEDADLSFQPGGDNPPLGVLCREIGETQVAYINAFKTFTQSFSYRHEEGAKLEKSVSALKAWYGELNRELKETVSALSEEEVTTKMIDRGPEFKVPPRINLTIFTEALLLFYGRATVYLRAMGKDRPQQWKEWLE